MLRLSTATICINWQMAEFRFLRTLHVEQSVTCGLGPAYLADALQPVTGIPDRQRL